MSKDKADQEGRSAAAAQPQKVPRFPAGLMLPPFSYVTDTDGVLWQLLEHGLIKRVNVA